MAGVVEVVLQDGVARLHEAEPGGVASIGFEQEDQTIASDLGSIRTQMVMLELPAVRCLLNVSRAGLDWHDEQTRAHYMGGDLIVVDQVDEDASSTRQAATIYQRVVLSTQDLEASLALAA